MKVLKKISITLFVGLFALNLSAQDKAAQIQAYNSGLEQAKAKNYDAAISAFTQAITIGEQIGEEGTDIIGRAQKQIPKIYYQKALVSYNAFRSSKSVDDLKSAIDAFDEVVGVAAEYGDEQVSQRSRGVIPQLYYQKGLMLFNREQYEESNAALDNAITANSNYALPYYQKGLVHKRTNPDDIDTILNWYNQAITIAQATNQNKVVRSATESAHDELLFRGAKSTENKRYSRSIELLELALTYDAESANVHYRLAEAHNKRGNATKALEHGNKALEYENGGRTDRAKIYFEIGLAYQTLENKGEACQAFGSAVYGSFKAPAEHIMEFELKCKSS